MTRSNQPVMHNGPILKLIDLKNRYIGKSLEIMADNKSQNLTSSKKYSYCIQKEIVAALRATGLSIEA